MATSSTPAVMENYTITMTITQHSRIWDIQHSPECTSSALFFHEASNLVLMFGPFIFAALSAALTCFIRNVTPGVVDAHAKLTPANSTGTEASQAQPEIPASNHASEDPTQEEPPPYQPSSQSSSSPLTQPTAQKPKTKHSLSAHNFVVGSSLFISNLITLFLIALLIQANTYCARWSPLGTFGRAMWWIFFGIVAWWASFGAMCWLMLLRNLWGPRAIEKFPIQEHAFVIGIFLVVFMPFGLIGQGSIKAIEACQRTFCGDAIEDDEDSQEAREEALELEEGRRVAGDSVSLDGDGEGEGSEGLVGVRDEERVGLMDGTKN